MRATAAGGKGLAGRSLDPLDPDEVGGDRKPGVASKLSKDTIRLVF